MRDTEGEIVKRLNIIIHLLLEKGGNGDESMTSKIDRLLRLGLTQAEVATVVGKPVNYVTAIASKRKARARSKTT